MRLHSFDADDGSAESSNHDSYGSYDSDDSDDYGSYGSSNSSGSYDSRGRAARRRRRFDPRLDARTNVRRGRLTEGERERLAIAEDERSDELPLPSGADRWTTWGQGELGPEPYPSWLITEQGAADTWLGLLKTGKEADVHLIERAVVPDGARVLLAEKRYRSAEHRLFHRDAGYLDGRRTKESRTDRAIANRTAFGRKLIAEQWAAAEFAALCGLWAAGAPVPYPVSRVGTDLVLEFIGEADGTAAPRLAQLRPGGEQLLDLWEQLTGALAALARAGFTHGDLSAYNILVHDGRLVLIDLPQVVDVVMNPQGAELLARDVRNIGEWFTARGLPDAARREALLVELLREESGLRRGSGER